MSRSVKKHPCTGWGNFGSKCNRKWKQVVNGQKRSANKQILKQLLNDPEGDELFVEDRCSLIWWIGEKGTYGGETWESYYKSNKDARCWMLPWDEDQTVEEKRAELWAWWKRYYLGK